VEMKDLKNSPPVGIKRVSHHPDFAVINVTGNLDAVPDNNDQWANDIAILELDQNITWSPLVQPACLPQPQHEAELYEDGRMALSSGWGGINQRYPDDVVDVLQLHYARMNVYNSQTCYNHLFLLRRFHAQTYPSSRSFNKLGHKPIQKHLSRTTELHQDSAFSKGPKGGVLADGRQDLRFQR